MQTLAPPPPAAEIPIEGMWVGGFVYPNVDVDQRSGRVVVAQRVERVEAWEQFLYDLPDWTFGLCVIVLVWLAWKTWRVARSPRTVGRLVCVRCAYDLTPAKGSVVSARCPECGVDTARRAPVLGRSFARRMLVPTAVGGAVLACGLAIFLWRLEPVRQFDRTRRWPPLIWPALSNWVQVQRRQPAITMSERIDVWGAADGRMISQTPFGNNADRFGASIRQVRFLPGGDLVAVTAEHSGVSFLVLRASDGEIVYKAPDADVSGVGLAGLAGASRDGKHVWYWVQRTKSDRSGETELMEGSLDVNESRSLGIVANSRASEGWRGAEVVAAEEGARVVWVSLVSMTNGAELGWPGGQAALTGPVIVDRASLQQGPGGKWSILVPDGTTTGVSFVWSVPLGEAAPTPVRSPALTLTAAGGRLDVSDASGAVVKSLSTAGASSPVVGRSLPTDHWYVAIGQRATTPHKYFGLVEVGGTFGGVVQVWDISVTPAAKNP